MPLKNLVKLQDRWIAGAERTSREVAGILTPAELMMRLHITTPD